MCKCDVRTDPDAHMLQHGKRTLASVPCRHAHHAPQARIHAWLASKNQQQLVGPGDVPRVLRAPGTATASPDATMSEASGVPSWGGPQGVRWRATGPRSGRGISGTTKQRCNHAGNGSVAGISKRALALVPRRHRGGGGLQQQQLSLAGAVAKLPSFRPVSCGGCFKHTCYCAKPGTPADQ